MLPTHPLMSMGPSVKCDNLQVATRPVKAAVPADRMGSRQAPSESAGMQLLRLVNASRMAISSSCGCRFLVACQQSRLRSNVKKMANSPLAPCVKFAPSAQCSCLHIERLIARDACDCLSSLGDRCSMSEMSAASLGLLLWPPMGSALTA